jgi:hypothetical protein
MYSKESFERRGGAPASDPTDEGASSVELEALVRELRVHARGVYGSLKRLVFVEWQRLRLRAVDAFFRAAFFLCVLGFALAASITAAVMILRGLRGAILAMSDTPWLGDLGAGLLILAIALGAGLAIRQHLRGRIVHQTRRGLASELDHESVDRAAAASENPANGSSTSERR